MVEKWFCSCIYHWISNFFSQLSSCLYHRTGSHPHLYIHSCFSSCLQLHFKPVFQVQAGASACPSCLITLLKSCYLVDNTKAFLSLYFAEGFIPCRDLWGVRYHAGVLFTGLLYFLDTQLNDDCPPSRSVSPVRVNPSHWLKALSSLSICHRRVLGGRGRGEGRKSGKWRADVMVSKCHIDFPGTFVSILPVQFESHSCIEIKWQW